MLDDFDFFGVEGVIVLLAALILITFHNLICIYDKRGAQYFYLKIVIHQNRLARTIKIIKLTAFNGPMQNPRQKRYQEQRQGNQNKEAFHAYSLSFSQTPSV